MWERVRGSGFRGKGSGITAPGSGITSHGIQISSFLRDQESRIWRCTIFSVGSGTNICHAFEIKIGNLGTKMGSAMKTCKCYYPEIR